MKRVPGRKQAITYSSVFSPLTALLVYIRAPVSEICKFKICETAS